MKIKKLKTILSYGRWIGLAVILASLGYSVSKNPVAGSEVADGSGAPASESALSSESK